MKTKFIFIGIIAATLLSIFSIQANAQHINYTYDANGNRVSRTYSPAFTMNNKTQNDTAADKVATQYGIGVYPNPLMDGNNVTVVISSASDKTDEQATVYVLDNTGKMLYSQKLPTAIEATTSPSQSDSYRIDLSTYSAGIYYIKVAIGKEQLFYKVTKAK